MLFDVKRTKRQSKSHDEHQESSTLKTASGWRRFAMLGIKDQKKSYRNVYGSLFDVSST
jgi:hypothetical protein